MIVTGEMRRKDKEIRDIETIEKIIAESTICRIGLCDDGSPYVVPVCFGYEDGVLYVHSAMEGKKVEILRKNNRVCVEFDQCVRVIKADNMCRWGMKYRSVIGFGKAYFVEDEKEKVRALEIIVKNYSDILGSYEYKKMGETLVVKVLIDSISGKMSGF